MAKKFWTEEKDALLRRDYPTKHLGSLAVRIGTTLLGLKTRAKLLHLHRQVNTRKPWTKRQTDYLVSHYADAPLAELIEKTRHGQSAIYSKAIALGLRKSREFKQSRGRHAAASPRSQACRFSKGHKPYNKGLRQSEFRSPEAIKRIAATQFKKGEKPHNARPVGYESFRSKNGQGYMYIKVKADEPMVLKHRWVWEQAHGPIPADCIITFRDGDSRNCSLSNLELISREEQGRRHANSETPEQRRRRCAKVRAALDEMIRRDRARIHFGLEPKSKLVKRW